MPEGWEWVRIKNFCLVIFSGKSPKYSKNETSHKVIGQQANQWSGVNMQYVKYCTNDFVREMPESYYLQNGDVLLNTLGNGTLGRSGIFYNNSSNERVLTDGHLFVFRTQNKVLSKYLLLFLRTKYDEIVKSANGTTNQTFLSLGKTSQWLIPVPPENEIIKIISELDKYEPLLIEYDIFESHKAKLDGEIYDKLKKSILQYAIQGKLVPQDSNDEPAAVLLERIRAEKKAQLGKKYVESYIYKGDDNCYYEHINGKDVDITEEIPYDLPIGWIWERLRNITEIIGDGIHGTPNFDDNGKYYFINGNNLVGGKIVLKDSTKKVNENEFLLHRKPLTLNTILLSINGTLGNIAYYNNEPIILGKSACYISLSKDISKEYVRVVLETKSFLDYAVHRATKTTIANISLNAIRTFLFPVPPLAEQKRIVEKIDEIFAKL